MLNDPFLTLSVGMTRIMTVATQLLIINMKTI